MAYDFSEEQRAVVEKRLIKTIDQGPGKLKRMRENLPHVRGTQLERMVYRFIDTILNDLVEAQIALQTLRGEPFPDLYDLIKDD